jgi:hypothetical protein
VVPKKRDTANRLRCVRKDGVRDFERFSAELATHLGRQLAPDDVLTAECQSLEIFVIWIWMDEIGATLPAGIEEAVKTPLDLWEHAKRRWEAGGS